MVLFSAFKTWHGATSNNLSQTWQGETELNNIQYYWTSANDDVVMLCKLLTCTPAILCEHEHTSLYNFETVCSDIYIFFYYGNNRHVIIWTNLAMMMLTQTAIAQVLCSSEIDGRLWQEDRQATERVVFGHDTRQAFVAWSPQRMWPRMHECKQSRRKLGRFPLLFLYLQWPIKTIQSSLTTIQIWLGFIYAKLRTVRATRVLIHCTEYIPSTSPLH